MAFSNSSNATAVVSFTALFEDPAASAATAEGHAAQLLAACQAEAHCAQCGVQPAGGSGGCLQSRWRPI